MLIEIYAEGLDLNLLPFRGKYEWCMFLCPNWLTLSTVTKLRTSVSVQLLMSFHFIWS